MKFFNLKKENVSDKKGDVAPGPAPGQVLDPSHFTGFFKNHVVGFDELLAKKGKVKLVWHIADGFSAAMIDDVRPGCGCTANITWSGCEVRAVYTNTEKYKDEVEVEVNKAMYVKFRDGRSKVFDKSKGTMVWPDDKAGVTLQFKGRVQTK